MSDFTEIMTVLSRRFSSGNSVAVESTRITKEEFEVIRDEVEELKGRLTVALNLPKEVLR